VQPEARHDGQDFLTGLENGSRDRRNHLLRTVAGHDAIRSDAEMRAQSLAQGRAGWIGVAPRFHHGRGESREDLGRTAVRILVAGEARDIVATADALRESEIQTGIIGRQRRHMRIESDPRCHCFVHRAYT
jgi:hypothetical protein